MDMILIYFIHDVFCVFRPFASNMNNPTSIRMRFSINPVSCQPQTTTTNHHPHSSFVRFCTCFVCHSFFNRMHFCDFSLFSYKNYINMNDFLK